jgi:hypothetical protein
MPSSTIGEQGPVGCADSAKRIVRDYCAYARYTAAADRASNAPYTVTHSGGVTDSPRRAEPYFGFRRIESGRGVIRLRWGYVVILTCACCRRGD